MSHKNLCIPLDTDYFPSRGAKNHKADAWIPLDASYKQYEYSDGVDMQSIAGLDINTTVDSFINSGEINTTEGSAKGFDSQILQDNLNDAQVKIKEYIDTLDENTTTLFDVVGGKKILEEHYSTLPSSLPNHLVVVGARYDKIPNSLQQRMYFYIRGLSQEFALDEFYNGRKTITLPMAKLNNEKVTISFAPATQSDEDALNALLPEGEITDESQLPSTIPSYIHVNPQLKVNGEVVQELGETALGETYTLKQSLYKPTQTLPFAQPRELISGGYYAVNTIVQSVSVEKLKTLQTKIKQTREILQSSNQTQIDVLTREDIMGDMVYAATLSYYAQMIAQGKMATKPLKTSFELVGSSGIIGYKPKIAKRFSLPTGLTVGGMNCDIVYTHMVEQSSGDQTKHVQSNQQLGMIGSALEGIVLQQLFSTYPDGYGEGFSAIKAIELAYKRGQKIFTVTKDNYQTIIPQLQLAPAAIADIKVAAQNGMTVTTHEKRISLDGYTGEGYMILNNRGTGAYMINGGLYGGIYTNKAANRNMFMSTIAGAKKVYATDVRNVLLGFFTVVDATSSENLVDFIPGQIMSLTLNVSLDLITKYFIIGSTVVVSPFIGNWNNFFIVHYYYGEGAPVDLKDLGDLGKRFENAGNVPSLVNSFISGQIGKLRTEGRCYEDYSYVEPVSNRAESVVRWDYHLFSIGKSSFFREVSCSGAICKFNFYIRDKFEEPIDIPLELPSSQIYKINYDFKRTVSCF